MPCRTPLTYTPISGPSRQEYLNLCGNSLLGCGISKNLNGAATLPNLPKPAAIVGHFIPPPTVNDPPILATADTIKLALIVTVPFITVSPLLVETPFVILVEFLIVGANLVHKAK